MQIGVPFENNVHVGRLVRRYKRFFVEFEMKGSVLTAHTSNTGSMLGMLNKGARVLVTYDKAPHRKLDYTLQAIEIGGAFVAANPILSNRFVRAVLEADALRGFGGYPTIKSEVKLHERTRLDFCLSGHKEKPDLYIEVKSATLKDGETIRFPDAVSERATKHLGALSDLADKGHRALVLFIAQREAKRFSPAYDIDPTYADAIHRARDDGVQFACLRTRVDKKGVWMHERLPVVLRKSW